MIYRILFYNFIVLVMFNFGHPVTPLMLVEKDVYSGLNSILFGFFSIASFLFAPFWGKYISVKGCRSLLIYMPLCYSLAQLMLCFADSSILMIVARFISGIFGIAFFIAISAYTNAISDDQNKAKNFGLVMVTSSLGGVVGQMFIGFLASYFVGYYFAFILQFITSLIFIIIAKLLIKEQVKVASAKTQQKFHITPFYIVVVAMSCAITMYTANIGFYITQQFDATSFQVALINTMSSIIMLLANLFLIKIITQRFNNKTSFNIQLILAISAMSFVIIFIYLQNIILIVIFIAIYVTALSIYRPLSQQHVANDKTKNATIELANIAACNSLGMVIGSIVGGIAYSIEPNLPFILMVVVLMFGFMVLKKEQNV